MSAPHQCPVCRAPFRGSRICSRCGAELGPLMLLAVRAWRLRQEAWRALTRGDLTEAGRLVAAAQALHRTARGASLQLLATWLGASRHRRPDRPIAGTE